MASTSRNIITSVIVPTYSRPVYLRDTLISLLQQDFPPGQYEIIVVDNRPTGEVRHIVQKLEVEWQRFIRYIEEPNVGLHNARHAGAKVACGAILVYVDDDILAHPEWLRAMLAFFKNPLVAIVGGKVLPQWETQPPEWLSQFPSSYLSLLDLGERSQELRWPKGVYGCNMAVRRSTLYEVGGFNPDAMGDRRLIWFRGDGETGLHRKIYDAGYKAIYEPRAWVSHRITPERLKARAFYDRGLMVGLSWSYSHIRNTKEHSYFTLRIIRRAFLAFLRAFRCCMRAVFQRNRRIRCISDAWLWYGYGMQHLYAAIIPRLRVFLLKDSYL
jgi:glycosyltransferase involved in cell wall biosynthesis